jgi:cyclic pyranopterin phosphate synthase
MPEGGVDWFPHEKVMRYEDILFLASVLQEMGVRKIRFTGGEPLVRKGFIPFLKDFTREFPDIEVALTTNGSLLSVMAEDLSHIRLSGLNISLDTLDPAKFEYITRVDDLSRVIDGIRISSSLCSCPIKINTVLIRNFNDDEIHGLLQFAQQHNAILRLIEFMPLDDMWEKNAFISADEILRTLPESEWIADPRYSGNDRICGPATYYRNSSTGQIIGIIAAVSHHFCNTCNRLRISALGEIKSCLFSETGISLGEAVRSKNREEVKLLVLRSVSMKPREWTDLKRSGCKMSRIGG